MVLVVRYRAIAQHAHHIGEYDSWARILIGIDENTQAVEIIGGPKHWSRRSAFLSEPHRHSITVENSRAMYLKGDFDLQGTLSRLCLRGVLAGDIMTLQLVADNGKRENSHPSCEGRSDVRRIYLWRRKETLENLAFLELAN